MRTREARRSPLTWPLHVPYNLLKCDHEYYAFVFQNVFTLSWHQKKPCRHLIYVFLLELTYDTNSYEELSVITHHICITSGIFRKIPNSKHGGLISYHRRKQENRLELTKVVASNVHKSRKNFQVKRYFRMKLTSCEFSAILIAWKWNGRHVYAGVLHKLFSWMKIDLKTYKSNKFWLEMT